MASLMILKEVRELEEFKVTSDTNKITVQNIETCLSLEQEGLKHLENVISILVSKVTV